MSKLEYRPNVCLLIFNTQKKLFLGERLGSPGAWQLPQGGIEPGTTAKESAIREAHEELGADIELFKVVKKLKASHKYDFRQVPDYAVRKWRGQKQSFYLIEFLGQDQNIQLDRFDQEFSGYKWCTVSQVRKKAESFRLPGYEKPLEEYVDYLSKV